MTSRNFQIAQPIIVLIAIGLILWAVILILK